MKFSRILLIAFLLFGLIQSFAQENPASEEKWTRIETDDKMFSFAFPQNNVIDTESRDKGQKLRVIAFQNDVQIDIKMIKADDVSQRFKRVYSRPNVRSSYFKVNDFEILRFETESLDNFENILWIGRKNILFFLQIQAKTPQEKEISRFFSSIKLQGKPLFVQKEVINFPEDLIAVSNLKTSPEIIEAYQRKVEKSNANVVYEASVVSVDNLETQGLSRRAIILERPYPNFDSNYNPYRAEVKSYSAKLKVNFLANGQIGDIIVLTIGDKNFTRGCVESAKKIRFVPAQKDGKNVDSVQVVEYSAQLFSVPVNPQ